MKLLQVEKSRARPILRWFGGKFRLAPWIIGHLPKHKIYVEPYGGAAGVLLRKPKSYAEVWNDLNDEVYTLFWLLRDKGLTEKLQAQLERTPYSIREFELAHVYTPDPLERSRRLIIRSMMGFGADSACDPTNKTGFRNNTKRAGSTPQHVFVNYSAALPEFHERLRGVVIENRDALEVMKAHDSPDTLHYLDPPYLQDLRRNGSYSHEMTDAEHLNMIEVIQGLKGKIAISGYPSKMYDALFAGWRRVEKEAMSDKAGKRIEVLWMNYEAVE